MKKISYFLLLNAFILGGVFFCLGAKGAGYEVFSDNFDSYDTGEFGTIDTGEWTHEGDIYISTTTYQSASNSVMFTNGGGNILKYTTTQLPETTNGKIEFSVRNWDNDNIAWYFQLQASSTYVDGKTCGLYNHIDISGDTNYHLIEIFFDTQTELYTKCLDTSCDLASTTFEYTDCGTEQGLKYIYQIYAFGDNGYLDDILLERYNTTTCDVDDYYEEISKWSPVIYPDFPEDCVFTETTDFDATATGIIEIPANNIFRWDKLVMNFENASTGSSTSFTEDLGGVYGFQWIYYEIPFDIDTGSYEISYYLTGYSTSSGENIVYFHTCTAKYGEEFVGWTIEEQMGCTDATTTDCSGMDWIIDLTERLWCEMSNFFTTNIRPTCAKIQEFNYARDRYKQRMPYNYLSLTYSFFIDTTEEMLGVEEVATTTTEYSDTLITQLNLMNLTYDNGNESFLHHFKTICRTLLWLTFIIWFIKRGVNLLKPKF